MRRREEQKKRRREEGKKIRRPCACVLAFKSAGSSASGLIHYSLLYPYDGINHLPTYALFVAAHTSHTTAGATKLHLCHRCIAATWANVHTASCLTHVERHT